MSNSIPARIAICGCNGNLGSRLVSTLIQRREVNLVLGFGRQPQSALSRLGGKFVYVAGNVNALPLVDLFVQYRIEYVIDLIFMSSPMSNRQLAYQTNLLTARTIFGAVAAAKVPSSMLMSSVAVYGPGPRSALLVEDDLSSQDSFQFAEQKVMQEQIAKEIARDKFALTIVRPCTIVGAGMSNFLLDLFRRPVFLIPAGTNPNWHFLHEDDFCRGIIAIVKHTRQGVYNLVPDQSVPLREALSLFGSRAVPVPKVLLVALIAAGWRARLRRIVPVPPSSVAFLLAPPLASNHVIRRDIRFQPLFSSRDALRAVKTCEDRLPAVASHQCSVGYKR